MKNKRLFLLSAFLVIIGTLKAQNPIITDQFTADPTAKVFEGKMYVYPSHDIPSPIERLKEWFCMADYHVFSSDNLVDWTDHGVILSQENVPWVAPDSYSMWAPECVYKNGKYYFYFPSTPKGEGKRGFSIGVAIADKPYGPFTPQATPIEGVNGIDPCVLIDKDGQAYIYWSGRGMSVAKLKDNMLELASEPMQIQGLPEGFKEGPFAFERNGKYYFTFPWVKEKTEVLAYAMGDNPMGPFEFKGIIMDESPTDCWTNHHSLVEYKDQWYLFYHHNDYSPEFDKNRSARVDSLFFNPDGTIQKSNPHPARSGHNRCPERNSTGSLQPVKQSGSGHRLPEPGKQIRRLENFIEQKRCMGAVQPGELRREYPPESESKSNLGQRRNTANTYKRNKWSDYLGNKSSQNR